MVWNRFFSCFLIGVDGMNKKTRAVDENTFKVIIATMRKGFVMNGVSYKSNDRIATILVLEYNLGLRVGDILQLKVQKSGPSSSRKWLC